MSSVLLAHAMHWGTLLQARPFKGLSGRCSAHPRCQEQPKFPSVNVASTWRDEVARGRERGSKFCSSQYLTPTFNPSCIINIQQPLRLRAPMSKRAEGRVWDDALVRYKTSEIAVGCNNSLITICKQPKCQGALMDPSDGERSGKMWDHFSRHSTVTHCNLLLLQNPKPSSIESIMPCFLASASCVLLGKGVYSCCSERITHVSTS